jgi:orotidine-5'-phosphate decarboxylase
MSPVTSHQSPELIVALDVDTLDRAREIVSKLSPEVKYFKIGSQLFTACGPEAVKMVGEKGGQVFLDLKFKDIPNTVYAASSSSTSLSCVFVSKITGGVARDVKETVQYPVFMMTVHTGDVDKKMLTEAVRGASQKADELGIKRPNIVGVTVLTSKSDNSDILNTVIERAKFAQDSGLDGVVCSVQEAAAVRKACGADFIIVTPGIRPKGYKTDDQKRKATAQEAIAAGADFIVVGRPILEAQDPLEAVRQILQERSGD